jgi:putative phosphoribosyl transferase
VSVEYKTATIATGGVRVLNEEVVGGLGIPMEMIDAVTEKETQELKRRQLAYRGNCSEPVVSGKTVILIDDGIATGSTMRAAVRALKAQEPARSVVAVPTVAASTCSELLPLREPTLNRLELVRMECGLGRERTCVQF